MIILKSGNNVEKLDLSYIDGGIIQKIKWQFLIKLHVHLSYDPAITLLEIYPTEMKP